MRLLVCGSEGSLMQATIPYLLRDGHEVIGVDNLFRYGKAERKRHYRFIQGDLADRNVTKGIMSENKVDFVLQAAARVFGTGGFHKYPADILAYDVALHQNLLWESVNSTVRKIIYISSSMVYERCQKVPSEEEDVADMRIPLTDYGLSKLVGERLCKAFHKQYGLMYTIWRPFNVITPFEKGKEEPGIAHVFADFIRKIVVLRQNPMEIFGDGQQIRCFTWIDDVASAIAKFSVQHITDCRTYNLGNPQPITMADLAQKIYEKSLKRGAVSSEKPLAFKHLQGFKDDVRVRIPSIEKAKSELGWKPTISVDQAIDFCVEEAVRGHQV